MRIKAFVILALPDVSLFLLSCDLVLSCNADHSPSDLQRLFVFSENYQHVSPGQRLREVIHN